MMVISMWLLISVSDGYYNRGNVTVVDRFPTAQDCEKVRTTVRNLGHQSQDSLRAECVQAAVFANAANVVKP